MKLIIDIPDEEYNRIKEWEDNITGYQTSLVLYRAVRNGIPYEERPQGDLISRDALKKAMEQADMEAIDYEMLAGMYEHLVRNAPTVIPSDK